MLRDINLIVNRIGMISLEKVLQDFIKFFGTAGARVVLSKQLRSSGGIWIRLGKTNLLLDPGPGTLIRCWECNPPFKPTSLDGIILTHRHLDHSGDMNVMVEAMADGGFHPKGQVFAPTDALEGPDPVLFHYLRNYPEKINKLGAGMSFGLNQIRIDVPVRHLHPVETYGIKLICQNKRISYITDTRFFTGLIDAYQAEIIIVNMTFLKPFHGERAYHLSCDEAIPLITGIKPNVAILTHFGKGVIEAGPEKIAQHIEKETGIPVIAATDGLILPL